MHVQALMMTAITTTPPFNPQTQGTLVSWYDASTLGLSNGAAVTTFPDSKTGNPWQISGGGSLTYSIPAQNGKGAISWPSGNVMGNGSSAGTYPYTIAAVVYLNNLTATKAIIGPTANAGLEIRSETSGAIGMASADTAYIGGSSTTISSGSWHLLVYMVDSSTYSFQIDGIAAGSGSHSVSLGASNFQMGAQKTNEEYFDGIIGEVQIYSSLFGSTDLSGLHTYAVNKWATP